MVQNTLWPQEVPQVAWRPPPQSSEYGRLDGEILTTATIEREVEPWGSEEIPYIERGREVSKPLQQQSASLQGQSTSTKPNMRQGVKSEGNFRTNEIPDIEEEEDQ